MSFEMPDDWPDEWEPCPMCNPLSGTLPQVDAWCTVCLPVRPALIVPFSQVTRRWQLDQGQVPGWITAAEAIRLALVPSRMQDARVRYDGY